MKVQLLEMDLIDKSNTHLHEPIEATDLKDAITKLFFNGEQGTQEVLEMMEDFEEKEDMWLCDGEELVYILFKQ